MNNNRKAFTLIELLMVIAIIGILAAILIPTVAVVREKATIATSKARLSQYLTAIQSFKGEYKYYPFASLVDEEGYLDLSEVTNSEAFYQALMARDISNPTESIAVEGNRRRIQFYNFTSDELADGTNTDDPSVADNQIIDGFGNNRIVIVFDHDSDGEVIVPDPDGATGATKSLRTSLTAFVEINETIDAPNYYIYE